MTARITLDLIRKGAEHNNGEISTLEELSLHQRDIVRLELLDTACKHLKILYLQNNLIPKIENVTRLRALEYLNLALNNVQLIEGLEGCEMLQKIDLTVNFVGDLTSVKSLRVNSKLQQMFLTGNPCTSFDGYRDYVLAVLPQLRNLDGIDITKSERIRALQRLPALEKAVLRQVTEYKREQAAKKAKDEARASGKAGFDGSWYCDTQGVPGGQKERPKVVEIDSDESSGLDHSAGSEDERFWEEESEFTPESRVESARHAEKARMRQERAKGTNKKKVTRNVNFFKRDGKAYNMNEGGWEFNLSGQMEPTEPYVLDLEVYKHLDSSQLDCDVQPNYVRVKIKDKYFQLALPEEVAPDSGKAERSKMTGWLMVTMPKVNQVLKPKRTTTTSAKSKPADAVNRATGGVQRLEVGEGVAKPIDIGNIVAEGGYRPKKNGLLTHAPRVIKAEPRQNDADFVDDDDVPPLM